MSADTIQTVIYLILLALIIGIILSINKSSKNDNDCQELPLSDNPLHINNIQINHKPINKFIDTIQKQEKDKKPILLNQAREGEKDNLQLIKGVGNVLEKVLNDMGIYHFDQIANWTEEEISWIDKSLAFPGRIKRENWVEQAKILASGKTTEFTQKVQKEKGTTSKKS